MSVRLRLKVATLRDLGNEMYNERCTETENSLAGEEAFGSCKPDLSVRILNARLRCGLVAGCG